MFSGIKRNSKNELIAIKADLKKGDEIAKKMEIKGTEAIKTFGIIISKNKKGTLTVDFSSDEIINNQKSNLVAPNAPSVTEKEIFINGSKSSKDEMDQLDPKKIERVDVKKEENTISIWIKNEATEIPDDKQVIISGVNMTELNLEKIDPKNINNLKTSKTTRTIKYIRKTKNDIPVETEIYIDGIKSNQTDLDKLNPNLIESMNVLKGINAITKYGKEGENGVIEIITKENVNPIKFSNKKSK